MSYSAGRLSVYTDFETEYENYTNATYDSMTLPLVNQLCTVFGMVIFSDLTQSTSRGNRYFIGYSGDAYPKFAIGWAVNNTQSGVIYLLCVALYEGDYLDSGLDVAASSGMSNTQYRLVLLRREFAQTSLYTYINYISDDNIKAITASYSGSSPVITSNNNFAFLIFKVGTKKMLTTTNGSEYFTYEYVNDGRLSTIIPLNTYFFRIKNYIANSDFEYIAQLKLEHNVNLDGVYIYSRTLTANKIYKINGEYYLCLKTNNNDGSFMVKVGYVA